MLCVKAIRKTRKGRLQSQSGREERNDGIYPFSPFKLPTVLVARQLEQLVSVCTGRKNLAEKRKKTKKTVMI